MIEYVAQTGSTNADLAERLKAGRALGEGDWLVADRQIAGRGRQAREWLDGSGNFMGSTVVNWTRTDPPAHTLALSVGLTLIATLMPLLGEPEAPIRLKWPNDVMAGKAKIAGVLLERAGDTVIVGIGVNLADSPRLVDREAVSLAELGARVGRDAFAEALAQAFATELGRWRSYGIGPVIARWSRAAHPPGTPLHIHQPDQSVLTGTFSGLSEEGDLQLRLADGATRVIHAGDVLFA